MSDRELLTECLDVLTHDAAQRTFAGGVRMSQLAIKLRAHLAAPEPEQKFDHSIGADRFKVVRGIFWWHIKIGDSPTEHGKFRSSGAAQKMADDLLREFRNGAFVQNAFAAPRPEPVAWMYVNSEGECEQIEYGTPPTDDDSITPLYTAPPPAAPRPEPVFDGQSGHPVMLPRAPEPVLGLISDEVRAALKAADAVESQEAYRTRTPAAAPSEDIEALRRENERLREENRLWYSRAVALFWRGDSDNITVGRLQLAAKEIDAALQEVPR